MKIAILHTQISNGGDAAIVEATMRMIRKCYGDKTEIFLYDIRAEAVKESFPNINFRPPLFLLLQPRSCWKRGRRVLERATRLRLLLACKLFVLGQTLLPLTRMERKRLNDLYQCDLVFCHGGTYLVENYNLFHTLFPIEVAVSMGKKTIMISQSMGPFTGAHARNILKSIAPQIDAIMLRDRRSLLHLKDVAPNVKNASVVEDIAFTLADPAKIEQRAYRLDHEKHPVRVAISVRDWPYFTETTPELGMSNYLASIALLVEKLVQRGNFEIEFLSTCQGVHGYAYDDSEVADKIVEGLSEHVAKKVRVNKERHTVNELLVRIAAFDVVVSTRMHFAILALCSGVPTLAISYEFKTKELYERLGVGGWCLDIESLDGYKLCNAFEILERETRRGNRNLTQQVLHSHESALEAEAIILNTHPCGYA